MVKEKHNDDDGRPITPHAIFNENPNHDPQPFLEYAYTPWYDHAAESKSQVEGSLESLLHGVYLSRAVYSAWSHLAGVEGTPLYQASDHDFTSVVKRLLKNGSNVFGRGYKGQTALHAAARRGFVEIALLILGFSTDCFVLDTQDHYSRTVLHEVALHGNETRATEVRCRPRLVACTGHVR